jgi:hypothetical protein
MKKKILFAFVLICVVLIVYWLKFSRESRAEEAYESATLGEPEVEIVAKVGEPDEVLPCGKYLWWNGDQANPKPNDGRCVKWVRYNFFLHAIAFGYSADGKLVSRYHYQSE